MFAGRWGMTLNVDWASIISLLYRQEREYQNGHTGLNSFSEHPSRQLIIINGNIQLL